MCEIFADNGYLDEKTKQWILTTTTIKDFTNKKNNDNKSFSNQSYEKYILTEIDLKESDLIKKKKKPDEMNYVELKESITRSNNTGKDSIKERVELYHKIAYPFTNIIILFFGLRLTSNVRKGYSLSAIAFALAFAFIYYGVDAFFLVMGENKVLHPLLAAWLGHMIFLGLGVINLFTTKK